MESLIEVKITKLVHGGQGLAELPDGRKVFVWNALPGEMVRVRLIKQKRSYAEAIAEEIIVPSPERIEPREANYLATSPWQIMTFKAENKYKVDIVKELLERAHITTPGLVNSTDAGKAVPVRPQGEAEFTSAGAMENPLGVFHYRNKMEYSFWGDDDGLHLALHQRGSKGKQIVQGSVLALPAVDTAAKAILRELNKLHRVQQWLRAGELKTIIVRANQSGKAVASLFVKPHEFPELTLPSEVQGLRIYHSNPKSPASVRTKLLYELGDCQLQDELLGKSFTYDVDSFFQVNIPAFEAALTRIKEHIKAPEIVDMYAGVGSIGLSVAEEKVELVELDPASSAMARLNAQASGLQATVTEASTEQAIQSILNSKPVIFDPPRAGLHAKVVQRCLDVKPSQIIYLSCNPATQARDLQLLQPAYKIEYFKVFNFFPRTPHIETLAVLRRV